MQIELTPDREEITADGMDLCFVKVRLTDANGITVAVDDIELSADVSGGTLAGFGSGNPCTDENYGTGKRRVWNGYALICLRAPKNSQDIKLKVCAESMPAAEMVIKCSRASVKANASL
jgi:beta-galactosidase